MRRAAALELADMETLVKKSAGDEHTSAQGCVRRWHQYIGHIDRDITYRRQLIIDYHREWESYWESAVETHLRRNANAT